MSIKPPPLIVVPNGNAIDINVTWLNTAGLPEVPETVRYQVFDTITRSLVSSEQMIPDPASEMVVTVPGTDLPGDTSKRRQLTIQLQAEFGPGDKHTELIDVFVARAFEFV